MGLESLLINSISRSSSDVQISLVNFGGLYRPARINFGEFLAVLASMVIDSRPVVLAFLTRFVRRSDLA